MLTEFCLREPMESSSCLELRWAAN